MPHLDTPQFLGWLVLMLGTAKLLGALARWLGQPAVLGELAAGVIVGTSVLGVVDARNEVVRLLADVGVLLLLFEIGLETDLRGLVRAGGAATVVACVGVSLSFVLGYAVCRLVGLDNRVAVLAGATLTATSVGITARVLSDLGRLQEPESQVVLGAAVLDDLLGLMILALVGGLAQGHGLALAEVVKITGLGLGFVAVTLFLGRLIVPPLFHLTSGIGLPGAPATSAVLLAFGLAWLAAQAGSAVIIGAFAAGLLLAGTPQSREIEHGVAPLGRFFVPLFFVTVGAGVDVRLLNPLDPGNRETLVVAGLLILAAVVGKFLAGYAPFWFRGRKSVIGAGMIPRGEVSLVVAQLGLRSGVFNQGLFSAVTVVVVVTTFLSPPLLKLLCPPRRPRQEPPPPEGVEELVTEPG